MESNTFQILIFKANWPQVVNAQNIEALRSFNNAVNNLPTLNKTKLVGWDDTGTNNNQSIINILVITLNMKLLRAIG